MGEKDKYGYKHNDGHYLKMTGNDKNFSYSIYDNIVDYCVEKIEQGNYEAAYNRYKNSVLALEEQFARPALTDGFKKALKLKTSNQ